MQEDDIDIQVDAAGNVNASSEPEAVKAARAQARKAERHLRQLEHRASTAFSLARGLLLDCAVDSPSVQAAALSMLPGEIADALAQIGAGGEGRADNQSALSRACGWMHRAFVVESEDDDAAGASDSSCAAGGAHFDMVEAEPVPAQHQRWLGATHSDATAGAAARLLRCITRRRGAELHVAGVFTALLRACGVLARLVVNFQVVPLHRAMPQARRSKKDGWAARAKIAIGHGKPLPAAAKRRAARPAGSAPLRDGAGSPATALAAAPAVPDAAPTQASGADNGHERSSDGEAGGAAPAKPKKRKAATTGADKQAGQQPAKRRAKRGKAGEDASGDPAAKGNGARAKGKRSKSSTAHAPATQDAASAPADAAVASTSAAANETRAAEEAAAEASAIDRRRRGDEELEAQLRLAMAASEAAPPRTATPVAPSAPKPSDAFMGRWRSTTTPASSTGQPAGWVAWTEAFCGSAVEGAWVHVDAAAGCVDAASRVEESKKAGPAVAYVVAFLAGAAKDVTRRYAASWMRSLRERDEKWWVEALRPLRGNQVRDDSS